MSERVKTVKLGEINAPPLPPRTKEEPSARPLYPFQLLGLREKEDGNVEITAPPLLSKQVHVPLTASHKRSDTLDSGLRQDNRTPEPTEGLSNPSTPVRVRVAHLDDFGPVDSVVASSNLPPHPVSKTKTLDEYFTPAAPKLPPRGISYLKSPSSPMGLQSRSAKSIVSQDSSPKPKSAWSSLKNMYRGMVGQSERPDTEVYIARSQSPTLRVNTSLNSFVPPPPVPKSPVTPTSQTSESHLEQKSLQLTLVDRAVRAFKYRPQEATASLTIQGSTQEFWKGDDDKIYLKEKVLGRGGHGIFYEATDVRTNTKVLVKVLPAQAKAQAKQEQDFNVMMGNLYGKMIVDSSFVGLVLVYFKGYKLEALLQDPRRYDIGVGAYQLYQMGVANLLELYAKGLVHGNPKLRKFIWTSAGRLVLVGYATCKRATSQDEIRDDFQKYCIAVAEALKPHALQGDREAMEARKKALADYNNPSRLIGD
ncbi:hypothetical protein HDU91_005490 [Kappamyces sp. JEL0680]|nr:hypothetical protein HDU91_005490 [Kappamyces sp. JEL0680]